MEQSFSGIAAHIPCRGSCRIYPLWGSAIVSCCLLQVVDRLFDEINWLVVHSLKAVSVSERVAMAKISTFQVVLKLLLQLSHAARHETG